MVRRRVLARGRVQGVFFRDSTRRRAEAEGVAGWVSNRDDGAVEAVLEGEPEAVDRLVDFVRRGPGRAEVSEAAVVEEEPEGLSGFRIV
ncbi:MAG: acylphosphatase [Solirubrobacterales bacterium]